MGEEWLASDVEAAFALSAPGDAEERRALLDERLAAVAGDRFASLHA